MANTIVNLDLIADRVLAVAHEKISFISTVNREYDEEFGKTGRAFKSGDTIRIKNPNKYTRRQNSRIMSPQATTESTQDLTVATQDGVDMEWNSAEMALGLDNYTKRCIEPAVDVLLSGIEADFIAAMTKKVYSVVGTAGTVPGASSDTTVIGLARAKLSQFLAPKSNRTLMIDSATMASLVNANKALFQPNGAIGEQFQEGFISRNATADFYENERVLTLTNGSDITGTTDAAAAVTDGGTTLSADTASPVTYVVGQNFTIAGVYACHPETKQVLPFLMQFTNTAGTGSGGDFTISPPTYLTGPNQNVCSATGAQLATTDFNSKTLVCIGNASTAYRYGLMYHRDAFTFATADLPLHVTGECVRKQYEGIAIRLWRSGDIVNDRELLRLDILYGWKDIRPEWATRVILN